MAFFTADFISFFQELKGNNHKDWFHENKPRYEKSVKQPFAEFVDQLINEIHHDDPEVNITAKDAIFRINRDIRFAKDKSPYKNHVAAIISPAGRKDHSVPGLYVQLNQEGAFIAGGAYAPNKDQLDKIRLNLSDDLEEFGELLNDPGFKDKFGEIEGEKNKRIPKEYMEAAEKQPLIYNKQFFYSAKLPPGQILQDDFLTVVMNYYYAAKPLMMYFRELLA